MRLFHRVLLGRIRQCYDLDGGQTLPNGSACLANNIVLNEIIRHCRSLRKLRLLNSDLKLSETSIGHLVYADDTLSVSGSTEGVQSKLDIAQASIAELARKNDSRYKADCQHFRLSIKSNIRWRPNYIGGNPFVHEIRSLSQQRIAAYLSLEITFPDEPIFAANDSKLITAVMKEVVINQMTSWDSTPTQSSGYQSFVNGFMDQKLILYRYRQTTHKNYLELIKLRTADKELPALQSYSRDVPACLKQVPLFDWLDDEVQKSFVKALSRNTNSVGVNNYIIEESARLHDPNGNLLKPDLIISETKSDRVYIVDIAVYYEVNDIAADMAKAKESKYDVLRPIVAQLYKTNINNVSTVGIPIGSRGSFSTTLLNRLAKFSLNRQTAIYTANAAARGSDIANHQYQSQYSLGFLTIKAVYI
ncbi:hypothetical protein ACOME3_009944 [Neoechinorhynchus agilis]